VTLCELFWGSVWKVRSETHDSETNAARSPSCPVKPPPGPTRLEQSQYSSDNRRFNTIWTWRRAGQHVYNVSFLWLVQSIQLRPDAVWSASPEGYPWPLRSDIFPWVHQLICQTPDAGHEVYGHCFGEDSCQRAMKLTFYIRMNHSTKGQWCHNEHGFSNSYNVRAEYSCNWLDKKKKEKKTKPAIFLYLGFKARDGSITKTCL